MSWKPSRSSGCMFDKFTRKAKQNRAECERMINSNEYLHFDKMNKFSKHIYLYWLNENKAHCALVSKPFNPENPFYSFIVCCFFDVIYKMLATYKHLLYKPMQKLFN